MTVTPSIEHRPPLKYIARRDKLHRDHLDTVVPSSLAAVSATLERLLITPDGGPLIRYLVVDYDTSEVEVHIGFPISTTAKKMPAAEGLHIGDLPAGRYAVVTHSGPYDRLVDTTAALLDWAKRERIAWAMTEDGKMTHWVGRVERYLAGPPVVVDPAGWRTEIAILLG